MICILALFVPATFAAKTPLYDLTFTASAARHEITASHLTVRPGTSAKISQTDANGKIEVEVAANPDATGGIFIAADMYHVDPDGTRRHLGKPQIVARDNEPARMDVGEKDRRTGRDVVQYSMSVLAKRKQ